MSIMPEVGNYIPPVLCTFRTLSLPESAWKVVFSGVCIVYATHLLYVGEEDAGPDGVESTTF